jgi:hypothetical protein
LYFFVNPDPDLSFVLKSPCFKVIGHACIEHFGCVAHDVDEIDLLHEGPPLLD